MSEENRIIVTGGSGFLGKHVINELQSRSFNAIALDRTADLVNSQYKFDNTDTVIHLASKCGGIGANMASPGEFFYDNIMMGINVIRSCLVNNVKKLVMVGTVCSYPKHTPAPFKEDDLWNGFPEETNSPYGIAKKALLVMLNAYRAQYGLNSIYLIPVNLYGPGDNFDLNTSHVIPALIRKCLQAKENNNPDIVCWGDGSATREFIYVRDAARAIVDAMILYNDPDPVNIGSGNEISIKDLTILVKDLVGYRGNIVWDTLKPNGQPRRVLDVSRARERFGFVANTSLVDGLRNTIESVRDKF